MINKITPIYNNVCAYVREIYLCYVMLLKNILYTLHKYHIYIQKRNYTFFFSWEGVKPNNC